MRRRDFLLMLASAAVGVVVRPAWRLAEAKEIEVTKTDEEWRRLLTPAQYQVLRHEATEPAGSSSLLYEHRKGVLSAPLANCRFLVSDQVRKRDRLAELLESESKARWAPNSTGVF